MITSKELIVAGIKPSPHFAQLLKCASLEEALILSKGLIVKTIPIVGFKVTPGSALEFLLDFKWCPQSIEKDGPVSNSEKKRWLQNRAVSINGVRPLPDDLISFPINELVFFPNSSTRKTTLR
jgi:hypothetical protein